MSDKIINELRAIDRERRAVQAAANFRAFSSVFPSEVTVSSVWPPQTAVATVVAPRSTARPTDAEYVPSGGYIAACDAGASGCDGD